MVVIDEADLVMDYGYEDDMKVIKTYLPRICQGFLMSATLSDEGLDCSPSISNSDEPLNLFQSHN